MNEIQVFNNPEFGNIRTLLLNDEPWFVGKDVAAALGYKEPTNTVRAKVDAEDKGVYKMHTPSGAQMMVIINESGFYCLVLSSKMPKAKQFKRWVTSEVLPALRKTGTYTMPGCDDDAEPQRAITSDDYIKAASIIAGCKNERLPYVMGLLKAGGLNVPDIQSIPKPKKRGNTIRHVGKSDIAQMIDDAIVNRGITASEIAEFVGCDRSLICNYRNGSRAVPTWRATDIRDAIETLSKY